MGFMINILKSLFKTLKKLSRPHFSLEENELKFKIDYLKWKVSTNSALLNSLETELVLIQTEINEIKESDTFNIIIKITDWDSYFAEKKIQLLKQLKDVKLQIIQKA